MRSVGGAGGGERAFELRDIDETYGEAMPYERDHVEYEARFYMRQSAMAMFELGRRLILLKEHEVHGEFMRSLERIGMEERTARRTMQATLKLANRTALSDLSPTKLYALAMLDDDMLKELDEGVRCGG